MEIWGFYVLKEIKKSSPKGIDCYFEIPSTSEHIENVCLKKIWNGGSCLSEIMPCK